MFALLFRLKINCVIKLAHNSSKEYLNLLSAPFRDIISFTSKKESKIFRLREEKCLFEVKLHKNKKKLIPYLKIY